MKAYLQVLSTGTADCPPSVVLHFDSQRYLINCGEGTQRLCMESRLRFSKIKTLLFTRTHWDCMGGAPGMLLTLSDVGLGRIRLLGGENLTHAMVSMRHFVYRNTMAVDIIEFGQDANTYKDENLRVTAVQVYPDSFERAEPHVWPEPRFTASPSTSRSNSHGRPVDQHCSPTSSESTSPPPGIGSKRSSDELQPVASVTAEVPESPQQLRRQILAGMFNQSKVDGNHPLATKKPKYDYRNDSTPNTTAAMTDVDMIEAARSASNDTHSCQPKKNNGRFMDLPRTSPNTVAISYIFQSPDYVGKFNKQAALDLKVKPGRLFGDLVNGKSVLSEAGEMVHPHQVISGARPGRVFMVIDCPAVEYLSSLVNAKEFERFHGSAAGSKAGDDKLKADCIVHFGNHSILSHPDYKEWMQRFGPETQHIVANDDYCSQKLIFKSQSASSYKLSKLDPTIFPIPYHDNTPEHDLAMDLKDLSVKAATAESMLTYILEPFMGWDRSEIVYPMEPFEDHKVGMENIKPYLREYYELAEKANEEIARDNETNPEDFPGKDVVLTALGTGSSHPSKYRNVSATLLDMPNDGTFLLDVGEGTYGQMFRQFGGCKRTADQIISVDDHIRNLKGIFISHLHADHHLGTVGVIDRWNKLRKDDSTILYLIAPLKFNTFLQEFSDVQDFGYKNVQFIESEDIVHWRHEYDHRRQYATPTLNGLLASSGLSDITAVDVIHCPWSYGISMTHKDGWKIVYSGDTRPSENLVEAGQGATVLLHEATFEDDMGGEALKKRHSTTQEAIMVGEGMEAKFTMLTHFSQRYPKIPQFQSENKSTTIGICFDLMSVKLGQMARLPKYLPALQVLYSPQSDEAQEVEAEGQDSELQSLQQHAE